MAMVRPDEPLHFLTPDIARATLRQPMIRVRIFVLVCLVVGVASRAAQAQETGQSQILSPGAGSILSGEVSITGSAAHPALVRYELAFAYDPDPTNTWFTFQQGTTPVIEGELGRWNTRPLTKGVYALRLRVYASERDFIETVVRGLQLNNARPSATPTATPNATATPTLTPTVTPTAIVLLTVTPLAGISAVSPPFSTDWLASLGDPARIEAAFWEGVQVALTIFGILGLYVFIQTIWRWQRRRLSR